MMSVPHAEAGDPVIWDAQRIGGPSSVDSCIDNGNDISEQFETTRPSIPADTLLLDPQNNILARIFIKIPTPAKAVCGWDCDSTHIGMEVPIPSSDTTRPARWPCHNPCEQCCPYYIYVANWRDGHKITEVQICTDRGCGQTPTTPLYFCSDTTYNIYAQDRSSHICMYCSNLEFREGHHPAFWIEKIDSCPRVQPTGVGADTTLNVIRDSLCISNCLRLQAPSSAYWLRYGDSLRIHLGLTGQCKEAIDLGGGVYDPPSEDITSTKCVWICLKWEDNLYLCAMLRVRDCECIPSDTCLCDPRRCSRPDLIYLPGQGEGNSTHGDDENAISQSRRLPDVNEKLTAPTKAVPSESALEPQSGNPR
jgi:hypothetical protein